MFSDMAGLRKIRIVVCHATLAAMTLGLSDPAYAYLDPGTGSMILQIVLGGVAGLAMVGKLYWSRITDFFSKLVSFGRKSDIEMETEKEIEEIEGEREKVNRP